MLESEDRAERERYFFETGSPLSHICETADALGPLVVNKQVGIDQLILSGDANYSRFRPGDRVELRTKDPKRDRSLKFSYNWRVKRIVYPSPGKIEVLIASEKPTVLDDVKEVFLFRGLSSLFNKNLIKKISEIGKSDHPIILGKDHYSLSLQNSTFKQRFEKLNVTQKLAVEYLISQNLSGAIQGPPGTGKTHLLQTVTALALSSKMKVCVASYTNAAVDNLLGRLVASDFPYDWVRIGNKEQVAEKHYNNSTDLDFVSMAFTEGTNECQLIGSTLHKLVYNSRKAPKFDLLIIDEAGQVPLYFWPFIQRLAKRVILVGDQFQLPPVLAADHSELPLDNVFSMLIDQNTPMLETQYRMRHDIQEWSSKRFYKGRLVADSSVLNRDFFHGNPAFSNDDFVVAKHFESSNAGHTSQSEANFITRKIEQLLMTDIGIENIGVICPYRSQAGVVNAMLQNRLGVDLASQVLIDTVERFQGQEREAIFLSLGSNTPSKQDIRFLSDPQRLNVSVTRAKSRFYCLFDSKLIARSKNSDAEDLSDFLGWVMDEQTGLRKKA